MLVPGGVDQRLPPGEYPVENAPHPHVVGPAHVLVRRPLGTSQDVGRSQDRQREPQPVVEGAQWEEVRGESEMTAVLAARDEGMVADDDGVPGARAGDLPVE